MLFQVLFIFSSFASAPGPCASVLIQKSQDHQTHNLIVYLEQLLERQVFTDQEFLRFSKNLDKNILENPFSRSNISSICSVHRDEIQKYIDESILNLNILRDWAIKKSFERNLIHSNRNQVRIDTLDANQKMIFYPVPAGSFKMGTPGKGVDVHLTHSFEMMSTAVTQKHWVEIMGENPSYFSGGSSSRFVMVDGRKIELQPDHPVENVTWWSAIVFANRLSEKYKLKPVYDLSKLEFRKTAENGTLEVVAGILQINSSDGSIYDAEGFRLPTEAEQEYVMKDIGRNVLSFHFNKVLSYTNFSDLKYYAWYKNHQGNRTHEVAMLQPLVISGSNFYDLHGNVYEWSYDWYQGTLKGGVNPQGLKEEDIILRQKRNLTARSIRGGGFESQALDTQSWSRQAYSPDRRRPDIGFRLVRTLKPHD